VVGVSMNWTDRELELVAQALEREIDYRESRHKAVDRLCLFSLKKVYAKIYKINLRRKNGLLQK
jgi:hypothetical protein